MSNEKDFLEEELFSGEDNFENLFSDLDESDEGNEIENPDEQADTEENGNANEENDIFKEDIVKEDIFKENILKDNDDSKEFGIPKGIHFDDDFSDNEEKSQDVATDAFGAKETPKNESKEEDLENLEKEMERKAPLKRTPFASKEKPKKEIPNKEPVKKSPEDEALEVKYMRLMADFQNFRRRTEKEKADTFLYANESIIKELLDVVDNFERAFETGTEDEGFKTGMEMILKQLKAVLERAGVVEIECLGQEFDPNFENAVMTEDSAEYDSGKVTKVLQKGYKLHDRVVRPAMVVTAN